jgi:hypothetical protein
MVDSQKHKATDQVYNCLSSAALPAEGASNLQRQEGHAESLINGRFKERIKQNLKICFNHQRYA